MTYKKQFFKYFLPALLISGYENYTINEPFTGPEVAIAILLSVIVCYICYYWAKDKSRDGLWAITGIFAPVSLVVLFVLKDKTNG